MNILAPHVDESGNPVAGFLEALMTTGELIVPPFAADSAQCDARSRTILFDRDAAIRADFGLDLPAFNSIAAEWAAVQLFQACQFLVCRDVPEATVTATLAKTCPFARDPATDYSVDLVFDFLPDLFAIAARLEPNDPLVTSLKRLAQEWPLSSVGITLDHLPAGLSFAVHPGLMRLYADRVTEKNARDRLNSEQLCQQLRADAGIFSHLLPFTLST